MLIKSVVQGLGTSALPALAIRAEKSNDLVWSLPAHCTSYLTIPYIVTTIGIYILGGYPHDTIPTQA